MKIEQTSLNLMGELLIDADYVAPWSFICITEENTVVMPAGAMKLDRAFRHPIIRLVNDNTFLVADARIEKPADNCVVFDLTGKPLTSFFAGDAIQDITIVNNRIVISYFDEGIYGMDGPGSDGLVVFNPAGKNLFGYNSQNRKHVIDDCYCICPHGPDTVLFYPYQDFPLIELNLNTVKEKTYYPPAAVKGSAAITSLSGVTIFHAPYDDTTGIYKWMAGDKKAKRIADYEGRLRGLKNGKFLSIGEDGFTVIDMSD